jgi:farnesyl-diphosphate farnesyltransferase
VTTPNDPASPAAALTDRAYQDYILQHVSRTFALTIPQLPEPLAEVVGNAYLLCRIADTIEDDADLDAESKRQFSEQFVDVVTGRNPSQALADTLAPALSPSATDAEHDLIRNISRVLRITHGFDQRKQAAMQRCVRIMADGMVRYQDAETLDGVADLHAMGDYCYYVAGVVGEMLTELFCDHDPLIDRRRDELMALAVSFGQGLQMTNILKDIWEDHRRGACWLPRDLFSRHGIVLREMRSGDRHPGFEAGLGELIGVAVHHLRNALRYTLLIPREQLGIRKFCLWALGMAVLSLRKLNRRRDFGHGAEVKISRRSVKTTVVVTSLLVKQDGLLRLLFDLLAKSLPDSGIHERLGAVDLGAHPSNN